MYAICQRNKAHLDEVGDKFGIAKRYTDFAELIADPERGCGPHQLARSTTTPG